MQSKEKFTLVRQWTPDPRILQRLQGTGLEHCYEVAESLGSHQHCNQMLEAIKDCYNKEDCCITLGPNKAISIYFGLEDVLCITGLQVDAELVLIDRRITAVAVEGGKYMVNGLGDFFTEGDFDKNKHSIKLSVLREKFKEVKSDDLLPYHVNAYVLYLVGTVIVSTSSNYISLSYLNAIIDEKYKVSAWGVAMLAHVHYCLIKSNKNVGGCLYFLMVWALERLPSLLQLFFGNLYGNLLVPSSFPLIKGWATLTPPVIANRHRQLILSYKECLQAIMVEDIIMQPYKRLADIPPHIERQMAMKRFRGNLMHPMHFSGPYIKHLPDKCPQQLGVDTLDSPKEEEGLAFVVELATHRNRPELGICAFDHYVAHWSIRGQKLVNLQHGQHEGNPKRIPASGDGFVDIIVIDD